MSTRRRLTRANTLLLAGILLVAGLLRFRSLDWHDYGLPHPDERAVASETFGMMERDDYRPTIHSWGHLGYYSAVFGYKGYLLLQHLLNGTPVGREQPLSSVSGPRVPHFRELVRSGGHLPLGLLGVLAVSFSGKVAHRVYRRYPRRTLFAGAGLGVVLLLLAPRAVALMLTPVIPDYEDVTYVGRFLSALFSTLSVGLVFAIGSRLYSSTVGLVGATFLTVAVLPVQQAHFFTVDNLQTFCVLLALWLAASLYHAPLEPGRLDDSRVLAKIVEKWARPDLALHLSRLRPRLARTVPLLYVLLGFAVGMAMASKFSSAPLLLVPLVAHFLVLHRARSVSHLALHVSLVLAYVAALGSWYHLQPFAWQNDYLPFAEARGLREVGERWLFILFSDQFARQILEQSHMVQGTGGGPWAQQFAHTTPFVTMTLQMTRWSLGWPLGLVCLGGFAWVTARNVLRPRAADLLLLSWTLVSFFVLGTFKATFPRYTMAVLPLIVLFGAVVTVGRGAAATPAARNRLRSRLGAAIALLAAGCGLLYSLAYLRVLERPHSWTSASLWILKNVSPLQPDGAQTVIAHEEWDDEIPLHIPPHDSEYGSLWMDPYARDDEEKAWRLASWLEQADWICLPTTRLYGTILSVPERYPITARYYKALFAGTLGFTLRRTVWEPPGLLGFHLDDLLADESHYVYDHPKAAIFEKTERLPTEELVERIRDPPAEVVALSRAQILRWREGPREQLDDLWRDPYTEVGVVTRNELEELVGAVDLGPSGGGDFLRAVSSLDTEPSVAAAQVAAVVGGVEEIDGARLVELRQRIAGLETVPAYRVGDVTKLLSDGDLLTERGLSESLARNVVAFLENERLPRAEVLERLEELDLRAGKLPPLPSPQPQRGARVRMAHEAGAGVTGLWEALKWVIALEILGIAVLPLCLGLFRSLPDAGYPLAKALGWVLATYLSWIAVNLDLASFTPPLSFASLALLALAAWSLPPARRMLAALPRPRVVLATELLFLGSFSAFALIRAYNPEIFWGEKTMDFSLYHGVLRGADLPPAEPWYAGAVLNYYYYGYVLVAYLTHLTGSPTAFGFNLALSAIPALTLIGAFSVTYNLTKRIRWGLLGAAFVGLIGNLDPLFQLSRQGRLGGSSLRSEFAAQIESHGFLVGSVTAWLKLPLAAVTTLFQDAGDQPMWDSFWATSRSLGQGMINEYPVWSWLFADLHAHVMVMPVSMLALSLLYLLYRHLRCLPRMGWGRVTPQFLILALILGTQLASNSWDFLAYTGFFVVVAGAAIAGRPVQGAFAASGPESWLGAEGVATETSPPEVAPPDDGRLHPPIYLRPVGLFLAAWTLIWPLLCGLHPFWLGLVSDHWIGFSVGAAMVALSHRRRSGRDATRRWGTGLWRLTRDALVPVGLTVAAGGVLFGHFLAHLEAGAGRLGLNRDGNIGLGHAFSHFGLFMVVTVAWIVATLGAPARGGDRSGRRRRLGTLAIVETLLVVATLLRGWWLSAGGLVTHLLLLPPMVAALYEHRRSARASFTDVLLLGGWGLAAASEVVLLDDRMNTVFKLYHPAWVFLAVGSAAAVASLLRRSSMLVRRPGHETTSHVLRPLPALSALAIAGCLFVGIACTYRAVSGVLTRNLKTSSKPTLDGIDFLRHTPEEQELLEAVTWLNRTTRGPEVIAEGFTDLGYDESARITKYTGLPILLGWPHHIQQRGRSPEQISERQRDLRSLYTSERELEILRLCRRYGIRFIYVGDVERELYGDATRRLERISGLRPVFRSATGTNVIFEVVSEARHAGRRAALQ